MRNTINEKRDYLVKLSGKNISVGEKYFFLFKYPDHPVAKLAFSDLIYFYSLGISFYIL